jgi:general secretion pathway protein K
MNDHCKQQGVALILVLWVLGLLTMMAGSFALTIKRESATVMQLKTQAQAMAMAQAGVVIAQAMLLHEEQAKRWRVDGSLYEIEDDHGLMRIRILSEAGKIDINSVPTALFHQVMQHAPFDVQSRLALEDAILDWRDDDEITRPHGAEKAEYQDAKLHYGPRNKPFRSLDELQMVLGMNARMIEWMQSLFTVYAAGQTEIELANASWEVLEVLPEIDPAQLAAYFIAKQKSILNNAPLPSLPRLENAGQAMASDMENTSDTQTPSDVSVVTVIVETKTEEAQARIEVVMEKIEGANNLPFQILKWHNQTDFSAVTSLFAENMEFLLVGRYSELKHSR